MRFGVVAERYWGSHPPETELGKPFKTHTAGGWVTLAVQQVEEVGGKAPMCFAATDTGVGIPPEF